MSLRARLVAAFAVLLLVALATLGVVAARSTRAVLLAQADEVLQGIELRLAQRSGARIGAGPPNGNVVSRGLAYVVVDGDGAVVDALPSGFVDDPDPLPDITDIEALTDAGDRIVTVPAVDGSLQYRAVVIPTADGGFQVGAVPIDNIDAAIDRLVAWLAAAGAAVALVGAATTWWLVREGLRPVDVMVDTATAIAAGDLTRRIPDRDQSSELGRLGTAFNDMVAQLEGALGHERAAQERLNQFVADASHELRTPLATLQGYAELYRKGALEDPDELAKAMGRIRKESGRMQRLVDDLFLLARLDRGQPLQVSGVDVASVVRDAIADGHAIEPGRPVTYDGPRSVVVPGDEQRLAQVMANLLANTRAHTPAGTPVAISATEGDGLVQIDVVDQGPGIPDGDLDRLFDRFHRADPSRARTTGGSGLGLAIVAAIVEAHHGAVNAANEPGQGARFTISLPGPAPSH